MYYLSLIVCLKLKMVWDSQLIMKFCDVKSWTIYTNITWNLLSRAMASTSNLNSKNQECGIGPWSECYLRDELLWDDWGWNYGLWLTAQQAGASISASADHAGLSAWITGCCGGPAWRSSSCSTSSSASSAPAASSCPSAAAASASTAASINPWTPAAPVRHSDNQDQYTASETLSASDIKLQQLTSKN